MVATPGDQIQTRPAPWPHFPHCPGCHQRLASKSRTVAGPEDGRCPHCGTEVGLIPGVTW
jgi:hypothetical protein